MRPSVMTSRIIGFCLTALALAACQAVAGIEDRTLDEDAGKPQNSQQCEDYCTLVMEACNGPQALYTTRDICLGVCSKLDVGDAEDTHNNTLACRTYWANEALREAGYCPSAGPGGNGQCGSDCEAYCQIFPQVCPDDYKYQSTKDCLKFCETVPQKTTFDVVVDHGGDSIECRLVHVSSAILKPKDHCPHAPIPPAEPWCMGVAEEAPTCEDYCNIEMAACTGEFAQYDTVEECLDVCAVLDPGTNADKTNNNVGCRRYHAYSASLQPSTHCSHSGPTGDGHCGHDDKAAGHTANCDSYCKIVEAACPTEFGDAYVGPENCQEECVQLPEAVLDSEYTVKRGEEGTGLNCRVLHSVRAFSDPSACAAALGGNPCQ